MKPINFSVLAIIVIIFGFNLTAYSQIDSSSINYYQLINTAQLDFINGNVQAAFEGYKKAELVSNNRLDAVSRKEYLNVCIILSKNENAENQINELLRLGLPFKSIGINYPNIIKYVELIPIEKKEKLESEFLNNGLNYELGLNVKELTTKDQFVRQEATYLMPYIDSTNFYSLSNLSPVPSQFNIEL